MSVEAIRSDWVGRVIDGKFSLLQWLGGSENCGVFLTELPGPQARKAAIKLISPDEGETEAYMAGWDATRPLSHPHLMRLFHTGRCEMDGAELIFVVNEYADEVLSEILPERALSPDEAKQMLEPVLDALSYLHGKGLVHGHLKPSNVMVVDDRLKLSGDSLQAAGETGKQAPAQSIYVAPEAETGSITPGADVWGLGVTLVEALTQHPPVWNRSVAEDPAVPDSIPQPFAGIARGCLRSDPMGRCTLENVKTWLEAGQPVSQPAARIETKASTRSRVPLLVSAAIVLIAVFAVVKMRPHQDQPSVSAAPAQSDASPKASADVPSPEPAPDATPPVTEGPPKAQDQAPAVATAPVQDRPPASVSVPPPQVEAPAPPPVVQASNGSVANTAVVQQVMPDVIPKALASIHGKLNVRVRVTLDPAGNVSDATFESEGPSQYFAKAAMQAAQKWKFKPTQAAPQTWILHFQFTSEGTNVSTAVAN